MISGLFLVFIWTFLGSKFFVVLICLQVFQFLQTNRVEFVCSRFEGGRIGLYKRQFHRCEILCLVINIFSTIQIVKNYFHLWNFVFKTVTLLVYFIRSSIFHLINQVYNIDITGIPLQKVIYCNPRSRLWNNRRLLADALGEQLHHDRDADQFGGNGTGN